MYDRLKLEALRFIEESSGSSLHRIVGRSMWPFLRHDMVARVEPLERLPEPGEILVYRYAGSLIAHRLIGDRGTGAYVICGDATPTVLEQVSKSAILGRVSAVWSSGDPATSPQPLWWLRFTGWLMVHSHRVRTIWTKVRDLIRAIALDPEMKACVFPAVYAATAAFIRKDDAQGITLLAQVEPEMLRQAIARHGMAGLFAGWFERAGAETKRLPLQLVEELRKARMLAVLHEECVLTRVRDIVSILNAADIPHILLKGAGRLAAALPHASRHIAGDVDVLIPRRDIAAAEAACINAGYADRLFDRNQRFFYHRYAHHRAPLWPPDARVPVELHTQIARLGTVSQVLDYEALSPLVLSTTGPAGEVSLLNRVGRAVHLAYHADRLIPLRDIVLLAEALKEMSVDERAMFDGMIASESKNAYRVTSAAAIADLLNGVEQSAKGGRRYLAWVICREAMPRVLQNRASILEGIAAGVGIVYPDYPHYKYVPIVLQTAWRWMLNLAALPLIACWYLRSRKLMRPLLEVVKCK